MPQICATLITLNEARNIQRAIRSLSMADEIVVVDSGSTDGTIEIADKAGARVIQHVWEGYSAQKNFAAREAAHDWILSLDADEELNADALAEAETAMGDTDRAVRDAQKTLAEFEPIIAKNEEYRRVAAFQRHLPLPDGVACGVQLGSDLRTQRVVGVKLHAGFCRATSIW